MGIYDRDYLRDESGAGTLNYRPAPRRAAVGGMRMWSVTTWLIIANAAVYLLNNLITVQGTVVDQFGNVLGTIPIHPIERLGAFTVTAGIGHLQLWRLITFQFLHAGAEHIVFNMIALYFFGPIIENYLGSSRYLAFYLLCGIAGPIMYVVLWAAHFLILSPNVPLVGASAGIFGILIAAAQVAPDATVLIYGIVPMRLRTMAWALLAIAACAILYPGLIPGWLGGDNAGGQAAHLGGAAAGYWLIKNPRWLNVFDFRRRPQMRIG